MDQTNQHQPAEEQKPAAPVTQAPVGQVQPATQVAPSPAATPEVPQQEQPTMQATGQPAASDSPTPSTVYTGDTGSGKKPLMVIGVIVALTLLAGGALFLMNSTNESKQLGAIQRPQPIVTKEPLSSEEKAIDSIDTGDPEKELEEIGDIYNTLE